MNLAGSEGELAAAGQSGPLLVFEGEFTGDELSRLGAELRERLAARRVPRRSGTKIFSAFVELARNVLHYGAVAPGSPPGGARGRIAVGATGGCHWIEASNHVLASQLAPLERRLQAILAMGPDQRRAAYRRQLDDDAHERTEPLSRGAGLGLLTVARACTSFDWKFAPVPGAGGSHARFTIRTRLDAAPRELP